MEILMIIFVFKFFNTMFSCKFFDFFKSSLCINFLKVQLDLLINK